MVKYNKNKVDLPKLFLVLKLIILFPLLLNSHFSTANIRDQAINMHIKLTGVTPEETVIQDMATKITEGKSVEAAFIAMENANFYNVALKDWSTPWTNEEADIYAPLNDYSATIIGMVRDDIDFRSILFGDILYTGNTSLNIPAYSNVNNGHYIALQEQGIDLQTHLEKNAQSQITGLPAAATSGVLTSRAAAKAFFKDGTNRAMFRFTLINHLCTDLEALKDTSRSPDRIRQDVSRSPGGDSRLFMNSCSGCHSGMDPFSQAFAYYNYSYNLDQDPGGDNGQLTYNTENQVDPETQSRVQAKYHINSNNFKYGFITNNDNWQNYWRSGINQTLGWNQNLTGKGQGAKSMGEELANSEAFASCQVKKVFKNVCLRQPQNNEDRQQINLMTANFKSSQYKIKNVFADAASYCKGN